MNNNDTAQHYKFLNSYVKRLADKTETKTEGKDAQCPWDRVWGGVGEGEEREGVANQWYWREHFYQRHFVEIFSTSLKMMLFRSE